MIELTLTKVDDIGDVVPGKKIMVRVKSIDLFFDGKVVVKGRAYSVIETAVEILGKIAETEKK